MNNQERLKICHRTKKTKEGKNTHTHTPKKFAWWYSSLSSKTKHGNEWENSLALNEVESVNTPLLVSWLFFVNRVIFLWLLRREEEIFMKLIRSQIKSKFCEYPYFIGFTVIYLGVGLWPNR